MDQKDAPGVGAVKERSAGELGKVLTEQLTRQGREHKTGLQMMGGGGLLAVYGGASLVACVIIALSHAVPAWLAAMVVGLMLLIVATILYVAGRERLRGSPAADAGGEAADSARSGAAKARSGASRARSRTAKAKTGAASAKDGETKAMEKAGQ